MCCVVFWELSWLLFLFFVTVKKIEVSIRGKELDFFQGKMNLLK
jgi:hypothetical protein